MFEIRNCGFINKGAQLMLIAIIQKLREIYPDCDLTMTPISPDGTQPIAKMMAAGLYPKVSISRLGVELGDTCLTEILGHHDVCCDLGPCRGDLCIGHLKDDRTIRIGDSRIAP